MIKKNINRANRLFKFPKGWQHFLLDSISCFFRIPYVLGKPVNVIIEPASICDLKCPVCETGAGLLTREKGVMTFRDYQKVIDKIAPFTNTILLYFMGEPFLNPDIYRMITYAKGKRIFVKICTNGQNIIPEEIFATDLDELQFQIGGITQQVQSVYRVNSQCKNIIDNVKSVVALREQMRLDGGKLKTKIYLGFIIMRHNEAELDGFLKLAGELGVDGARIESPCVRNIEQAGIFLPRDKKYWLYDDKSLSEGVLKHKGYKKNHCLGMYYSMTITWDGRVIPCCRDANATYMMGNLFDEDIDMIWNNKRFLDFRKRILRNSVSVSMCTLCDGLTFPSLEKL